MKYKEFGKMVSDLKGDMSCRRLAIEIGKTPTFVHKILKGECVASNETLDSLAGVLGSRDTLYALAGRIPEEVLDVVRGDITLWNSLRKKVARHGAECSGRDA